jgi:hypothetical protein
MRSANVLALAAPVAGTAPRFLTASWASELGILLALSVMFPFMIHLLPVPEDARLGARLLPMFYAPLLAALLGRTQSGVGLALVAPWLNWLLTRHPSPPSAALMTVQLLVFFAALRLALGRVGPRWYLAAPAYFLGLAASMLVAAAWPGLIGGRPVLTWAANTVTLAWPGVAVLVLINWLVLRFYPPGSGRGPLAAA